MKLKKDNMALSFSLEHAVFSELRSYTKGSPFDSGS